MKVTAEEQKRKRHEYYLKNKDKFLAKAKKWKELNPEKYSKLRKKETAKFRNKLGKEQKKHLELKQKYNLSFDEYINLYNKQNGVCAICKSHMKLLSEEFGNKTANVDHCHQTGRIRGLLCNSCNCGIGFLQDNSTLLRLAAEYLDACNG